MHLLKRFSVLLLLLFTWCGWAQTDSLSSIQKADTLKLEDDPSLVALDSLYHHTFFFQDTLSNDTFDLGKVQFPDSIYEERMSALNALSPMALDYNPVVRRYIDMYLEKRRSQVSRMMGLAQYYFPLFEATLDKYNMPLELKYLAIVESALNPKARSRVGAKGLWQFMYATGLMNGLSVNSYVDDRFDPIKSTEAACRFMTSLYKIYGDWNLVLAAYNSGPGNVNKAIRRSGGKRDYWHLRPYLPRETAGYVPAFIAVNYVMSYAEDHGLRAEPCYFTYREVDTIHVKEVLSFDQIMTSTGVKKEELEFLNPGYNYKIIPKVKGKTYSLVLPTKEHGIFVSNEDSIYKRALVEAELKKEKMPDMTTGEQKVTHRVRSGESLGSIANKYGVSVSKIKRWNGLRSDMIRIGQRLTIYPRKNVSSTSSKPKSKSTAPPKKHPIPEGGKETYTVQSGDTLYDIAKKYSGISADQIQSWNNLRSPSIQPGMKLVIYTGK